MLGRVTEFMAGHVQPDNELRNVWPVCELPETKQVFDLRIQTTNPNPIVMVWLQIHLKGTLFHQTTQKIQAKHETRRVKPNWDFGLALRFGKSNPAFNAPGKLCLLSFLRSDCWPCSPNCTRPDPNCTRPDPSWRKPGPN